MKKTPSLELEHLSTDLRTLVSQSVALLGRVIEREIGKAGFSRVERIRKSMAELRSRPAHEKTTLDQTLEELESLSKPERHALANSFTLMLQLMNACENAYRSHRLTRNSKPLVIGKQKPDFVIYVLTAHPTEARSPQSISIFHQIQSVLIRILDSETPLKISAKDEDSLLHLLEIAWRTPIVRDRAPKVKDEAEHIYSTLLRDDILTTLMDIGAERVPFYIRSWVGGDKDGHPGVDEKTLLQSLNLSRTAILRLCTTQLKAIRATLSLFPSKNLYGDVAKIEKEIGRLRALQTGDAKKVQTLRDRVARLYKDYEETIGHVHPSLKTLKQLLYAFPALVVPLELRESSDVLMAKPIKGAPKLAIEKMLATVARLSKGGDPRWYTRGFIISMTESIDHIRAAATKQQVAFGALRLPIIPLFEESESLADSERIVSEMTADPKLTKAAKDHWDGMIEIMVGYSDSAKEAGVLASRLAISEALPRLEKVCEKAKLTPVFFHGSGGSVDRGGGSVEDQTAWWPKSALRRYKVTVQGEMVERSLATPAIARGQIEHIIASVSAGLEHSVVSSKSAALDSFAKKISGHYREQITSPKFLELVERATPYSYLKFLKIGSRPVKRTTKLTVSGLRAIPWVMCWTQTRILFPTWWGVGSAWESSSKDDRSKLREDFKTKPVFTSYVKALGFTLAKIELAIWRLYLEQSSLPKAEVQSAISQFETEYQKTLKFHRELTGQEDLLWYRPWLGESIRLRSAMIHPLNIIQILAERQKDAQLLRVTVTGISSGMLTTG
jgi:phosphoenolpyruvate carboxylase